MIQSAPVYLIPYVYVCDCPIISSMSVALVSLSLSFAIFGTQGVLWLQRGNTWLLATLPGSVD